MIKIEKIKEFCWLNWRLLIVGGLVGTLVLLMLTHSVGFTKQPTDRLPVQPELAKKKSVASTQAEKGSKVCIDIKGAVNRPGVYHLLKGSRVEEAIAAAGGSTSQADLNQVNLAKELLDQQVIQIPQLGEQVLPLGDTLGSANNSSSSTKVNLNTATKEELTKIDGVGDKKADKILEYRNQHGGFKTPDDLKNITGFGEKTVAKLKDQLAV